MKIKVAEATGVQLDWMVAKAEGFTSSQDRDETEAWLEHADGRCGYSGKFNYTTDWAQGGPIIERQEIELLKWAIDGWKAKDTNYQFLNTPQERVHFAEMYGPTPLIAAMRCFVASKLGDEVEVPGELA